MSQYTRPCNWCDSALPEGSRSNRKYCSEPCQKAAKNERDLQKGPTCNSCGKRMHRGKGVLPQGQARCLECKNAAAGYYEAKGRLVSHGGSGYKWGCRCEVCIAAKRDENMAYKARVKAEHGVNPSTMFNRRYRERTGLRYRMGTKDWISPKLRLKLYERDGWMCHLCDKPVDKEAHFNDDLAPSLDHLKPRSKGGSDEPSNLRTAHRVCNSTRRDDELEAVEGGLIGCF